jgi:hypothetical protein
MGLQQLQVCILTSNKPHEFAAPESAFERLAREHHLFSLSDITIDRAAHHPLLEVTTQLLRRFDTEERPTAPP